MTLNLELSNFVLTWGELASHWGLNRTEAQIHALLFVSDRPLSAEEIGATLEVAPSHVSTCIRELLGWSIISRRYVTGDRRAYYTAEKDVWRMFRLVAKEQKRRELDPFIDLVRGTAEAMEPATRSGDDGPAAQGPDPQHAYRQIEELDRFLRAFEDWYSFIDGLSIDQIKRYLKLGKKVRTLLGE